MLKIGWGPKQDVGKGPTDDNPEGIYVIKPVTVPRGAWFFDLPIRVRWGFRGAQDPSSGVSVFWKGATPEGQPPSAGDPILPDPLKFIFCDHHGIEPGAPGDADSVYPLKCGIVVTAPTELLAVIQTTGVNVCTIVDGDGIRLPAGNQW